MRLQDAWGAVQTAYGFLVEGEREDEAGMDRCYSIRNRKNRKDGEIFMRMKIAGMKLMAWTLTAVMFLTGQGTCGLSVWPETETVKAAEREMPKNPVHYCTMDNEEDEGDNDVTDWSYVYFGTYPQTEVTGNALTAAITGASYDAAGDAWVNGMKYRRISANNTNNNEYFGGSVFRYFKWERIKWRVLKNDGNTLFVISDKGLDCKDYHDPDGSVTWETCTLRNWLNNDFYEMAFNGREQGAMTAVTVVNEDNPGYGTEGGNNTQDRVFVLSFSEAVNQEYGFCQNVAFSASRRIKASDYAGARGTGAGDCNWWLRTPGDQTDIASVVHYRGFPNGYGNNVSNPYYACVPAIHIQLSSDCWLVTDDGTSGTQIGAGEGQEEVKPGAASVKGKIKAKKRAFLVKWKTQPGVSGYQIQYSTNKKFKKKGTKIKTVQKPTQSKVTVKKLKAGKKYFVRIRTYKTVKGTNYYSAWSKSKSVKVKS